MGQLPLVASLLLSLALATSTAGLTLTAGGNLTLSQDHSAAGTTTLGLHAELGLEAAAALKTDDASTAGCASSLDCSLNGDCDAASGQCKCDDGWEGPGCASLDLAPQTADAMLNETNISTWGAPAVFAEGAYHAYVSEMVDECGITSWQSNSQLTQ